MHGIQKCVLWFGVFYFNFVSLTFSKTYTVGVEKIPYLPYSDVKNGEYVGKFKQLLDEFSKKEKIEIKYVPRPISRLHLDFMNQDLDFKIPANPLWKKKVKEERNIKILYSDPIFKFTDGVMVKRSIFGKGINFIKRLGTVTGFTPWVYVKYIEKNEMTLRENSDLEGLIKQGVLGRVDGVYVNKEVAEYYLKHSLKKEGILVFDKSLPHVESEYHMATIKHKDIITKFNHFLKTKSK